MKKYFFVFTLFLGLGVRSQVSFPYELVMDSIEIPNLPGLHSYAFAQHDGKWLIIGGRTDGIHPRQPFASFPESDNNKNIFVIDVENEQFWSSNLTTLATGLQEHMQSTNMNFLQVKDTLYIIGGYAFSSSNSDHITFPKLTTVQVPALISAVINAQNISPYFKQITDARFAVTGGQLGRIANSFYLIGGHRFDGRYNPMGHNTFVQTYTDEIRRFEVSNAAVSPVVSNFTTITDAVHLHRRDYNLLPQIFPDGREGYTISSGVFQINADLPYLYPVDITSSGISAKTSFNQYLSNYHSATSVLYDSLNNVTHNLFFGGMSQYYYSSGTLQKDDQVPFVKTISRLSRAADSSLYEFELNTKMPGLKGSSAEFIPNLDLPHYESDIFKLSEFTEDTIVLGHIYGGIESSALHPFSTNRINLTNADEKIYTVFLVKSPYASDGLIDGHNPFEFSVFPNPSNGEVQLEYRCERKVLLEYYMTDVRGRMLKSAEFGEREPGYHKEIINIPKNQGQYVILTLVFDGKYFVSRQILLSKP